MPKLIISDLPAYVNQRLEVLAASNGLSLEAQVCAILTRLVETRYPAFMGEALWEIFNLRPEGRLTTEEWTTIEACRDRNPAEPMTFD